MTKSELITSLSTKFPSLTKADVEDAVKHILRGISLALADGRRVEIRGFGSFRLNERKSRIGRNPRTGQSVQVPAKNAVHFKAGIEMRGRVDL